MSIGACRVISNPAACLKPLSCTYLWSASPYFPGGCPPRLCRHGHRSSLSVTRCVALLACLVKELVSSPCHILFRRSPLIVNLLRKTVATPALSYRRGVSGLAGPSRGKPSSAGTILGVPELLCQGCQGTRSAEHCSHLPGTKVRKLF